MQTYYPSRHFNQPQGHTAYNSRTVNGGEAGLGGGGTMADGVQSGGLMNSNVVAMSKA